MKNRTDNRNVKQTQFDGGQVIKGSFSELNSGLRSIPTNSIIRDVYTHFINVVDAQGRTTEITYYQATEPAIDTITFVADVAKSLASKYIIMDQFLEQKTVALYYVVGGTGVAPGVADIEIAVPIADNDTASIVAFATKIAIESLDYFTVASNSFLSPDLTVTYLQFGETDAINVGTTGFTVVRDNVGVSVEVGHAIMSYSGQDIIYLGNTLKNLVFNPYTASFESSAGSSNGSILAGISWDYFATTFPSSTTTQYEYKTGGVAGTVVATVTVTFTDASKCEILNVGRV